ncbi:hypothetical protein ACFL44_00040 [Gemmatimonadota bacterium]
MYRKSSLTDSAIGAVRELAEKIGIKAITPTVYAISVEVEGLLFLNEGDGYVNVSAHFNR